MKKEIVLISETGDYTEYAKKLFLNTDIKIVCAKPDINRYDAVVFVFDKEPHNNSQKLNSWVGHSHIRCVWGKSESEKRGMLKRVLMHVAGLPVPLEIERKYLIDYPDTKMLENMGSCLGVEIEQIYLLPTDSSHIRIRKRSAQGKCIYIKTEKQKISDTVRIEKEEEISKSEYEEYASLCDDKLCPVTKTRYCLMHNGRYFEIDVFPFWSDKAYLEIELADENEKFDLPEFISPIKEVTSDPIYTNRSLAKLIKSGRISEI